MATERFGASLRDIRKQIGWSQVTVAEQMCIRGFRWQQATVWKVERGERKVFVEEAIALGSIFRMSVEALAGYDDGNDVTVSLVRANAIIDQIRALTAQ